MPIPFILGGLALAAAGVGIKKGLDAKEDFDRAETIKDRAERKYKESKKELETARSSLNRDLERLGRLKLDVYQNEINQVVNTLKKIGNAKKSDLSKFEDLFSENELKQLTHTVECAFEIASSLAQGTASGVLTGFGAYGAVGALASASTGTAISALSGVAATNATLAWLGGGSLAAGGFGMAGGMAVLGGVIAGPAIAIAGFVMASKAEEAVTKAVGYRAEVDIACEQISTAITMMDGIVDRIDELRTNILSLRQRFEKVKVDSLDENEIRPMLIIGKALKDLININLIDSDGNAHKNVRREINKIMESLS